MKHSMKQITEVAALVCVLVLTLPSLAGGRADTLFESGNRALLAGDAGEAIAHYEEILQDQGAAPELFHNLALARASLGEWGAAVLNVERALWTAPRDRHIRAAAERIRAGAGLPLERSPRWAGLFHAVSMEGWGKALVSTWFLFGLAVLAWGLGLKNRAFAACVLMLIAAFTIFLTGWLIHLPGMNRAVVLGNKASLLVSPYDAAQATTVLQEGQTVKLTDHHGDYIKALVADGTEGWLAGEAVEYVVPRPGLRP